MTLFLRWLLPVAAPSILPIPDLGGRDKTKPNKAIDLKLRQVSEIDRKWEKQSQGT